MKLKKLSILFLLTFPLVGIAESSVSISTQDETDDILTDQSKDLIIKAKSGHADSQCELGEVGVYNRFPYSYPRLSLIMSQKEGMEWLRKSANNGSLKGQYEYGVRLMQKYPNADGLAWITKAADKGYVRAQIRLNQIDESARQRKEKNDKSKNKLLLKRKKEKRNMIIGVVVSLTVALFILLHIVSGYRDRKRNKEKKIEDERKNKERKANTLEKAHEGDADAQFEVSEWYSQRNERMMWLIKAAKQGHKLASERVVLWHQLELESIKRSEAKEQQDILEAAELAANLEAALAFFEASA